MNTERLFNVVLLKLTIKKLKIEDDLEKTIASDTDLSYKSKRITKLIEQLVLTESAINKFNLMVSTPNNENKNKNTSDGNI